MNGLFVAENTVLGGNVTLHPDGVPRDVSTAAVDALDVSGKFLGAIR